MQQIFNQKKEVLTLFILPQQAGDISSISLRKIQFTFSTESILSLINPNNARLKQLEGVKRESSLLIVIMGFFSKFKTKKEQPSSSDKAPAGTTSADDDDEKKERKAEKLASEQPGKQPPRHGKRSITCKARGNKFSQCPVRINYPLKIWTRRKLRSAFYSSERFSR